MPSTQLTSSKSSAAVLALGALTLALGCGGQEGAEPDAPPTPNKVTTANPSEAGSERESGGSFQDQAQRVPAVKRDEYGELAGTFPADLDTIPNSVITDMRGDDGTQGRVATFETETSQRDAVGFYRRELEGDGWQLVHEESTPLGSMLSARRDGQTIDVMVSPDGDDGTSRVHVLVR